SHSVCCGWCPWLAVMSVRRHDSPRRPQHQERDCMPAYTHYAILTAMLAPAFFLTATASLLMSANSRLARVVDRLRSLLHELESVESDGTQRDLLDRRIVQQRQRTQWIPRGS